MSTNFEWVDVAAPINLWSAAGYFDGLRVVAVEGHELEDVLADFDADEPPSGHVLAIGGENGVCIEAERPDQLVEFARTLLNMAEGYAAALGDGTQFDDYPPEQVRACAHCDRPIVQPTGDYYAGEWVHTQPYDEEWPEYCRSGDDSKAEPKP